MIYQIFVLVFVTLVNTEWVEITQRYHTKPDKNNYDTNKYTTSADGDNNSERDKVNLESGTRETLFLSKKQSEHISDIKRPAKGNRIYIRHDDNADRFTPSYPKDHFLKHNVKLNENPYITISDNVKQKNVKSHIEEQQIEANKKDNRVFITQKNSNKQDMRESLENIGNTEIRKNNFKKLQSQEYIHNTEQSTSHTSRGTNDNEIKSTTERIRVITSKKGNRIYFLYNNNRPSLVKNKKNSPKNDSDIKNTPLHAATSNSYLEDKHEVIKNTTENTTSHKFVEKQYQEQSTSSYDSNNHRSTSTTQSIDKIKTNKKNTEEHNSTKGKITETINKIESKTNISELELAITKKNNHKLNTNTRNYFTTEAVRVLTSKKGNKIYFIYKDMNIDEPTLENYENITEVTSPSTAIDKSLELESSDDSNKDSFQSNTKPTYETVKGDTTKITNNNKINTNEKTDNTAITNVKNKATSNLNISEKVRPENKNDTAKNKWIKGHVYRVPNVAHVSKINKNDPELLNITHMNIDKEHQNEDTIKHNIFIKEHPTAIVDKTKLESYDELPMRRKVDFISDGESTPEFVTNQDQDFDDRFEEIYIVDGDDEISELLEEEMKRTENGNFRIEPEEEPYIDSIKQKSDDHTAENKDESEINQKRNPIENIIKFMKVVADNIAKNTHTSYEGKIRYLKELKESIMRSIEERIDAAWPDDVPRSRRDARGHHIEFPSSESALMSISFLTFAVYLIKLVLYVIQAYKNKTAMFPAVVAVSRAAELADKLINNN